MTLDQLLTDLTHNQIVLFVDGDRLRYRAPDGALNADMRTGIAQHRKAIIANLQAKAPPSPQGPVKCITCDRQYWVDEQPRSGRIRTICSKCGQFIGYRPVNPQS
ncbi:MAG: hypothetical protein KKE86_06010 [Planctomycetes bacterium]|nr:hypothetical protein [Planctomycetota bacterium]MBU4398875.1 hypothetical protein [Planctomycetota bacterium]MCG2681989.1 hypothetical protein [Planctomycetales bacterium]